MKLLTHTMAMIQPSFTSSKWNMGKKIFGSKCDAEKWSRKNVLEISSCKSHFFLINFTFLPKNDGEKKFLIIPPCGSHLLPIYFTMERKPKKDSILS